MKSASKIYIYITIFWRACSSSYYALELLSQFLRISSKLVGFRDDARKLGWWLDTIRWRAESLSKYYRNCILSTAKVGLYLGRCILPTQERFSRRSLQFAVRISDWKCRDASIAVILKILVRRLMITNIFLVCNKFNIVWNVFVLEYYTIAHVPENISYFCPPKVGVLSSCEFMWRYVKIRSGPATILYCNVSQSNSTCCSHTMHNPFMMVPLTT